MKIPSWWPHDNTPAPKDLELDRLVGRIGVLTKRVEQLELQFGNMWEDCCNMWGRIKSLEQQSLWNEGREDKAEAIRRTIRFVRDGNNADKRRKRKK